LFVYSIVAYCGDPGTPVNGRRLTVVKITSDHWSISAGF